MNTFGRIFRVSIFGESHGPGVGALLDGCPAGLSLVPGDFVQDMDRRRAGDLGTTGRHEKDGVAILSGVLDGRTTGAPILLSIANEDAHGGDYADVCRVPRPGHGDLPAFHRYGGFNDRRGGGHLSGRLTAALVAAGVVAKKALHTMTDSVHCTARLIHVGGEGRREFFERRIGRAMEEGESVGGVVEGCVDGLPAGVGEPFFDTLDGLIAQAMFAIPGVKGVEFGLGFDFVRLGGNATKDEILGLDGQLRCNHSGGVDGGLSNGNPVVFRVAVKPAVSFGRLESVDYATGEPATIQMAGRHDTCFARRVPVIVEALSAIVVLDQLRIAGKAGEHV